MANWRTNEFLFKAKLLLQSIDDGENKLLLQSHDAQSARYLKQALQAALMEVFENNYLEMSYSLSFSELMALDVPVQELNVVRQLAEDRNSWLFFVLSVVRNEEGLQGRLNQKNVNVDVLFTDKKEWFLLDCYNECQQLIEGFRQTSLSW